MNKIRTIANILRVFLIGVMILLPFLHILLWLCVDPIQAVTSNVVNVGWPNFHQLGQHWRMTLAGMGIDFINVGFDMLICYFLVKLFGLYANGKFFTRCNVMCFRHLSITIIAGKLTDLLVTPFLSYVVTRIQDPNNPVLFSGIKINDISIIVFALFLLIISWIMGEAVKLQEEQELTI